MIGIIFFSLLGVGIGVFLGIVPGMHINNLLPLILLFSISLNLQPSHTAVLVVSTAIAEIFMNFIPSIFLGAPEEDTSLSILPGHRLLLEGRGYEAIKLTVIGGLGALLVTLALVGLISSFFVQLYPIVRSYLHYLLILVIAFMILSERSARAMLSATFIVALSGALGLIALNSAAISQQNILFPILAGLFGISTLIVSFSQRTEIPKQAKDTEVRVSKIDMLKSILLGSAAGVLVGFLPAIGISTAAMITQSLAGLGETRSFLINLAGINVANELFALTTLFLVGNPRSGSSVAVQRILVNPLFSDFLLLIGAICFSAGIAAALTLWLGRKIPRYLEKVNYRKLCSVVIAFLVAMMYAFTGPIGLLVGFTSTAIGLLCLYLGIRRSHCMAVLLIPAIVFFAGLSPQVISFLRI